MTLRITSVATRRIENKGELETFGHTPIVDMQSFTLELKAWVQELAPLFVM